MPYSPGDRVLTRNTDPAHHTRVPRYARGRIGTIVEHEGAWALPEVENDGVLAVAPEIAGGEPHGVDRFDGRTRLARVVVG